VTTNPPVVTTPPDEVTVPFQISFTSAEIQALTIQQQLQQVRDNAGINDSVTLASPNPLTASKGGPIVDVSPTPTLSDSYARRWTFFVEGLGGGVTVDTTGNANGYDFDTIGAMMGASYLVNDHFAIGGMGGYTRTDASLVNGGSIEADSYRGAVFATVFSGGFYLDGQVGLAHNTYDIERASLLGRATGSTDGLEFSTLINGGYDHHIDDLTLGVFSSLGYTRVNFNSFTETGSLAPLSYPDQHQESLRSNLGVRIAYSTEVGRMTLTPQARVSWQHEFLDSTQSIDSNIAADPGPVLTANGPHIGRDSLLLSAGLHLQITPVVGAYAFYGSQIGRTNYNSHNVTAGVSVRF